MNITDYLEYYLYNLTPLWDEKLTTLLVNYKLNKLSKKSFLKQNNYSLSYCVIKDQTLEEIALTLPDLNDKIKIVFPDNALSTFYLKHGLLPATVNFESVHTFEKVTSAMRVLQMVKPVHTFILQIVKSIQIIEAENSETDISYSHPDIPFSIFFSVCDEISMVSDLRVAESILHESMHLLLSLAENITDFVVPNSKETFYSPWRDEQRPVRGVLHGMFVFKGIKDFYQLLLTSTFHKSLSTENFIKLRLEEIDKEMQLLVDFTYSNSLTRFGKALCQKSLN